MGFYRVSHLSIMFSWIVYWSKWKLVKVTMDGFWRAVNFDWSFKCECENRWHTEAEDTSVSNRIEESLYRMPWRFMSDILKFDPLIL